MKTLYLDCFSGISGDMTLGAFIDLGVDANDLISELKKLNLEGYTIEVSKKAKNGIMGTDVDVILHEEEDHHHEHDRHEGHHHEHDHEHEGHHHEHDHEHEGHHHEHDHEHGHSHEGHEHSHDHRNFKAIKAMIDNSTLDKKVKELSKEIFYNVAKAEAKIHGKEIDEVHFHEVGAVDSIVDIVGAAICFCKLDVDKVVASPLHTGIGMIKCQHGIIPIPAPATLEILREGKVPFYSKGIEKEMVTPTGAAIVATLADEFHPLEEGTVVAVGYGCGKRDMKIANMLRMMLVETKKKLF